MAISRRIGFYLPRNISLLGLDCALETLRLANRHAGKTLYEWFTIARDRTPIETSNGLTLHPEYTINDPVGADMIFVCGGVEARVDHHPSALRWLRENAHWGRVIGGITTGTYTLARAGLLDGYSCTIHWEAAEAFKEEFPEIDLSDAIYVIDRNRLTSAGGLVTIDLFLQLVSQDFGAELTLSMASALQLDRMRTQNERQSWSNSRAYSNQPKKILLATRMMEKNIEVPMPLSSIADRLSISPRQLHRIFTRYLRQTPSDFYRAIRLKKARHLVMTTNLSMLEISVATGFESQSAFSRSYREMYGLAPRSHRHQWKDREPLPPTATSHFART